MGDEHELVRRLRAGDEVAFMELVTAYDGQLRRLARTFVRTDALADDVAQETSLAVLNGIERFEERSSLKTWIFRILTNIAKTRGERERRSVPFSSAARAAADEPSVDPDRFLPAGDEHARAWAIGPIPWPGPEESLLSGETRDVILDAIEKLPPAQREVIRQRVYEGKKFREIAEQMGCPLNTALARMHEGLKRLRLLWGDCHA